MKKLIQLALLVGTVTWGIRANAQKISIRENITSNEVVNVAQQNLSHWLQQIEPDQIKDYGFAASDNFSDVKVGQPFYMVNLPRTESTDEVVATPFTVMVPVILNGTARCAMYVSQEEGTWKVVGIGEGNFVASQLEVFNTETNNNGDSRVIVSVPHLSQLYLMESADSFKPLIQFENGENQNISMEELVRLNNSEPMETAPITNQDRIEESTDQPNQTK